jgi:hypothetical protein
MIFHTSEYTALVFVIVFFCFFFTFGEKTDIELVQIIRSTSWFGLKIDGPKDGSPASAAPYPLERGIYLPISENECLLWTQGSVAGVNV